jgi:hypothetical protein
MLSGCVFDLFREDGENDYHEMVAAYLEYDKEMEYAEFSGGAGTKQSPYVIATPKDLKNLSIIMRPSNKTRAYANAYYVQTKDIDLGGIAWIPIGFYDESKSYTRRGEDAFAGSYDGQGHEISNMKILIDESAYITTFDHSDAQGLFGAVCSQDNLDAGIRNLTLKDADIVYRDDDMPWHQSICGGLVGLILPKDVSVENCTVASISINTTAWDVGMFVGENNGMVNNSYAKGSIQYTVLDSYDSIGGGVGYNAGNVKGCRSDCDITMDIQPVTDDEIEINVGGFVGRNGTEETELNQTKIEDSKAIGRLRLLDKKSITLIAGSFAGESWSHAPIVNSDADFTASDNGDKYPSIGALERKDW